ncbi:MAG: ABC transporter substrate-binding protein [Alphaproteobacteria bacterium]|nr:ABC transporter substrate-binding protein [Alphaproteobacteria bacterium]
MAGIRMWTLGLCAALAAGPAALAQTPGVTADSIKIGSFGPITGANYLYGKLAMNGVEVAFDEVNKQGGIHGRKLTLVREDDRCDPATAIAAVKKLIFQEQVFAISGGGCSNSAVAARDEVERAAVPWVVFAAVHDGITTPPAPTIFSTALTSSIESAAQVEFAVSQGAKRIAILSMRDSWGRARYAPLMEAFKKKGITPVADEEISPDANDATPQVLRLRQANPDAVILVVYPKPAAIFLRDATKFAFKPLTIGQSAIADPAAFEEQVALPGATSNFVTISQVRFSPSDPEMEKWRTAIEAKFPGDRLSVFNMFGIGSAQALMAALRAAGPDLTREKFVAAMAGLKDVKTDTYGGLITCSTTDHRCNKAPAWLKKEPGGPVKLVAVTPVE